MPLQPFSPLEPNPILAHAARPERRLPFLLSCLVYAGFAFVGYKWMVHPKAVPKAALETRRERIFVIDLAKVLLDPPTKSDDATQNKGGGQDKDRIMPPGSGTIDEQLLKLRAVDSIPDPSTLPDKLPLEPPTPGTTSFLGTKNLPIARGGDGRPRGGGSGTGGGTGEGTGDGPPGKGAMTLKGEDLDFVNYVKPEYPRLAVLAGVEGVVWVRVIVTEDGRPLEVKALSGPGILIPNTLKAVMTWKFGSLRRRGVRGTATVDVSVLFMLIDK